MASNYPSETRRPPRSNVGVHFVGDDDVDTLVDVPKGRKRCNRYSTSRQIATRSETPTAILTKSGPKILQRHDDESTPTRRITRRQSTATPLKVDEKDDVSADFEGLHIETPGKVDKPTSALYENEEKMIGFPTNRPRQSIKQKAFETVSKASETPKQSPSTIPKQTPAKTVSTPYSTRGRLKKRIGEEATRQQFDELMEDLDSDYKPSESSSESEESSDDMSVLPLEDIGKPIPRKTFNDSRRRTREKISVIPFQAAEYFERQGMKSVTSNNTLNKLKADKFCRRELHKLLKQIKTAHARALDDLKKDHQGNYKRWMLAMSEGYNVLLYGVGSKIGILNDFGKNYLNDRSITAFVNGFFPGTTLKEIFEEIAFEVLKLDSISTDPRDAIAEIEQCLRPKWRDHLFLLVSNIDGEVLRADKIQSTLAELAALPKVHMVATCDHINAPLLWDQKKLSQFNFIWEDVTSLIPYTVETSYENSLMIENSGDMALASLRNVFRSLNANSKKIFKTLLDYQLQEGGNKNYPGMSFSKLYQLCRQNFIVSSDLALRTQLTEYTDHNLVKWKSDTDHLLILVDRTALEQFQAEIQSV